LLPEIPENHEGTAMKKQINPSIKAHLLRSALILLSLLAICAIPFALAQSHGRGINNRSVSNRAHQSQFPPENINSPRQNIVSSATLQPSVATHETRAGLQAVIEFPNANKFTPPIETVSSAPPTLSGCLHEQLVQQLRERLPRLGRWQC